MSQKKEIKILNTNITDLEQISQLFAQAMALQGKRGYQVWQNIDQAALLEDIENGLQYKIMIGNALACIFTVQYSDPLIWNVRDQDNAIYLHRIVVDPSFKGQRLFEKVLNWAKRQAFFLKRRYVRMDTWASNDQLITYYQGFGFQLIDYFTTPDAATLPLQNRNLNVALLEMEVKSEFN